MCNTSKYIPYMNWKAETAFQESFVNIIKNLIMLTQIVIFFFPGVVLFDLISAHFPLQWVHKRSNAFLWLLNAHWTA